jgi:hypothetical protein
MPYINNEYKTASGKKWPMAEQPKEDAMATLLDKLDALIASTEELYEQIADVLGLGIYSDNPWQRKRYSQIPTIQALRVAMYKLYYILKFFL